MAGLDTAAGCQRVVRVGLEGLILGSVCYRRPPQGKIQPHVPRGSTTVELPKSSGSTHSTEDYI